MNKELIIVVIDTDHVSQAASLHLGFCLMDLGFSPTTLRVKSQPKAVQIFKVKDAPDMPLEFMALIRECAEHQKAEWATQPPRSSRAMIHNRSEI